MCGIQLVKIHKICYNKAGKKPIILDGRDGWKQKMFAENLSAIRRQKGYTQRQLAELSQLSVSSIEAYEEGAKGCRCLDRCSGCVRRSRSVLRSWNKTGSRKSTPSSVSPNRLSSGCLRNKKAFCVFITQNAGETGVIRRQPAPWNAVCCGIRAFRKHAPIFLCGSSADTGRNERRCPSTWRHTSRGGPCAAAESE